MMKPYSTKTPSHEQSTPTTLKNNQAQIYRIDHGVNRRQVETFINHCFYNEHGAHISQFAPELLALTDKQQTLVAALGYKSAGAGPLFLEQYLRMPIEQLLGQKNIANTQRSCILEVGNLASVSSGSTRRLILSLITYFYAQGFRWLVITMTPKVFNSFEKLGIDLDLTPLAKAKPECLTGQQKNWGSYYREKPVVYAGNIASALEKLNSHPLLSALIQQAQWPLDDESIQLSTLPPVQPSGDSQ